MNERQQDSPREAIEGEAEDRSGARSSADHRLAQDLSALSRAFAEENQRSIERIWTRLVSSDEAAYWLQDRPLTLSAGTRFMEMEDDHTMSDAPFESDLDPSTRSPRAPQQPRRSFAHTLRLGAIAAVLFLMIVSWATVSSALHPRGGSHTGPASQRGVTSAKLLCSASYSTQDGASYGPIPLVWSAQGSIASADPYLHMFSAQTCAAQTTVSLPGTMVQPVWAPDGQRLLLLHLHVADVVDPRTGHVLVSFRTDGASGFDRGAWTPDGRQIVTSDVMAWLSRNIVKERIQVWDANTGAHLRTVFTFDDVLNGAISISPDGAYLAVQKTDNRFEFWNISTGTLISRTIVTNPSMPLAWSPDGKALATIQANPTVQVWSTISGKLTMSFNDSDAFDQHIYGLAWSPNGRYLAESGTDIHIWDVTSGQTVSTFGKVDPNGGTVSITAVAWSPDSSRLASVTTNYPDPTVPGQDVLDVWQLS